MNKIESGPLSFFEASGITPQEAGSLRRSLERDLLSSTEQIVFSGEEAVDILFIRPQGQSGLFLGTERVMDLILNSYLDTDRFSPESSESTAPAVIAATKRIFKSQRRVIPVIFGQKRRYNVLKESFWQGTRQNQWQPFKEEPTGIRYTLQLAA